MATSIKAPYPSMRVTVEPLTAETFKPFGIVITNPVPHNGGIAHSRSPSPSVATAGVTPATNAVSANQGTALKYADVNNVENLYDGAPSRKRARVAMNMFVCSPRELKPDTRPSQGQHDASSGSPKAAQTKRGQRLFPITILERHPFTSQTFIPLGLSPASDAETKYLVIVAPTAPSPRRSRREEPRPPPYPLPPPRRRRSLRETFSNARPAPFAEPQNNPTLSPSPSSPAVPGKRQLPGPGPPNLREIRAFIADGSTAVTYGPGTWHAPMVVLGKEAVDFVVVQYQNGVSQEDCQEIKITNDGVDEGIVAVVPELVTPSAGSNVRGLSKL